MNHERKLWFAASKLTRSHAKVCATRSGFPDVIIIQSWRISLTGRKLVGYTCVSNHPRYLNPGTAATFNVDPTAPAGSFPTRYVQTNTTFGVITGTRDPRTIQFGLKFNF